MRPTTFDWSVDAIAFDVFAVSAGADFVDAAVVVVAAGDEQ